MTFCGEEEQRNEREATFDAKHKKVAASDIKLATTLVREGGLEPPRPE